MTAETCIETPVRYITPKPTYVELRDALSMAISVIELGDNLTVATKNLRLTLIKTILEAAMAQEEQMTKLYAVSTGNGNDGVSHSFPSYYVHTDDPWRLAKLAMVSLFIEEYKEWAAENVEVNGDAEHTISAVIDKGPIGETEFGMAYAIVDVFADEGPDMSDPWHTPVYDSIEDAFDEDDLALVKARE